MLTTQNIIILVIVAVIVWFVFYNKPKTAAIREGFTDYPLSITPEVEFCAQATNALPTTVYSRSAQPVKDMRMIGPGPEMAFQGVDPSFFHSPVNPNDPLRMAQSVCPCNDVPNELKGMSKEDIEKEIAEKITKYKATFEPGDYLPEVSPHPLVFGKDPRDPTAICAPRNVYASKKDKNYEGGSNLIRGDIPIMPGSVVSNVSAKPHQRLARGAMQTGILGGDIPTILSAGDMFVYNTRYDAGYDRLQLMAGEGNCGAVSYLKS